MQTPVAHANPAKLMLTLLAGHMVAPAALLNRGMAFSTLLRVGRNPICCFTIVLALFEPSLGNLTSSGHMVV